MAENKTQKVIRYCMVSCELLSKMISCDSSKI